MRHIGCCRRTRSFPSVSRLAAMAVVVMAASAARAEKFRIHHRLATPHGQTLLALPGTNHKALLSSKGGFQFAGGDALSVAPIGAFAPPTQRLLGGRWPIVTTTYRSEKLAVAVTAFLGASPPTACLRAVVHNPTASPIQPVLRVLAQGAHGRLPGRHVGFRRGGQVFALCELRPGSGKVIGTAKGKRSVFRRQGGRPMPDWGQPNRPCDRGFRDIVAGWSEAATYHLQARPKQRYIVAVGLCESHWKTPGKRICDILIEGRKVATIDPIRKPHGHNVPFVLLFPAADRDGNGWISVTSAANGKSPDVNSIVNVLWLFEASVGRALSAGEILAGRANPKAHCYVNCGGSAEAPGPARIDYRLDIPPNGSATLWVKKPLVGMKTADLARVDPAALLSASEKAWRSALARAVSVEMCDPAPVDLFCASAINLLSLRAARDGRVVLRAGPFGTECSPDAAAFGAVALDRAGFHTEAAELLADLGPRQGNAATGEVLWALVSHYELTGDKQWLAANYRAIRTAADAIIDARELTKWVAHDPRSYFHGLMPAAPYHGRPADYWLARDFWACRGLRWAAHAAQTMQKPGDDKWFEDNLADYTTCLRRSLAKSRVIGPAAGCLPAVVGEAERWSLGSLVAGLYPRPLLTADEAKRVAATVGYVDKHSTDCLPTAGATVDVPLACRYALARLGGGDREAALGVFAGIANVATHTGSLPERANPAARGATGPIPSAASAAGYVLLLRDMLVRENGEELHLFPCVPRAWLAKPLTVTNAPTAFGPLRCRATLTDDAGRLVVDADVPRRRRPGAVILHPPLGGLRIRSARADRGQATIVAGTVRVVGWQGSGKVEIDLTQSERSRNQETKRPRRRDRDGT